MVIEGKAKGFVLIGGAVALLTVWWFVMQASATVGIEANQKMLTQQSYAADIKKKELDNLEREIKLKQQEGQTVSPAEGGSGLQTIAMHNCDGGTPLKVGRFQAPAGCALVVFQEKTNNMQWWGETRIEHTASGRSCGEPAECVALIGSVVEGAENKTMKITVSKGGFFMNWGSSKSST